MAGPWEKYQQAPAAAQGAGPWQKYSSTPKNDGYTESSVPLLDRVNAFGNSLVNQIPFVGPTLSDFGNQVDAAWASMIEGKPVSPEERKAITESEQAHFPVESTAGAITGAVSPFVVAGAIPRAARLLGMSGSLGSRIVAGGISGGLITGGDSLARGDDPMTALQKTGEGAGIGAGLPVVGKLAKMGWDAIRGAPAIAAPVQTVANAAVRDRLSGMDIQDAMTRMGPSAILADAGPNLRGQAAALATMPGEAQGVVAAALNARKGGTNTRIIGGINGALGQAPVPSRVNAEIKADMDEVSAMYPNAFKYAKAVDTQGIANDLDADIVNLRGDAQSALKKVRGMLDVTGSPGTLDPNPYTLWQTRQAIDGMLQNEANGKVASVLTGVRKRVDDELARSVPDMKVIDGEFAELAKQREGLDYGRTTLGSGPTAPTPTDLADYLSGASSGVKLRVTQGNRAEIERIVGTTANDLNALKTAIKGDGSWNRQRLAQLYGQEKTDRLINLLDNEVEFDKTYNAALGNSKTAATQAAQHELSGEVGGLPTSANLTGLVAAALTKGGGALLGANKRNTNIAVARMLMGRDVPPQLNSAVAKRLKELTKAGWLAPAAGSLMVTRGGQGPAGYALPNF